MKKRFNIFYSIYIILVLLANWIFDLSNPTLTWLFAIFLIFVSSSQYYLKYKKRDQK